MSNLYITNCLLEDYIDIWRLTSIIDKKLNFKKALDFFKLQDYEDNNNDKLFLNIYLKHKYIDNQIEGNQINIIESNRFVQINFLCAESLLKLYQDILNKDFLVNNDLIEYSNYWKKKNKKFIYDDKVFIESSIQSYALKSADIVNKIFKYKDELKNYNIALVLEPIN